MEHLKGNIEALALQLSNEDIKEINAGVPFDLGFLFDLISSGQLDDDVEPKPIRASRVVGTN